MKLFQAGANLPPAILAGGGTNLLFGYGGKRWATDRKALEHFVTGISSFYCSVCGSTLIRIGEHLVCPDIIRRLGTPEDIKRLEELL